MLCARIIGQQCLLKRDYEYARKGYTGILVLSRTSMNVLVRELVSRLETLMKYIFRASCGMYVAVIAASPS